MARKSDILKQHRNTLYLLAACIVVLGLVYLLTIARDLRNLQALSAHLADASRLADTQKLLVPLVAELQDERKASEASIADGEDAFLPGADMSADNYEQIIGEIVRQCGLKQTSLTPDIQSILSNTDALQVNLAVRGDFPDFRRLMLALAGIPFVSGIEDFRVEASADTGLLEMSLQLRLQVAASGEGAHERQ